VSRALTRHAAGAKATTNVELEPFARAVEPALPSSASPAVTALVGASTGGLLGGLLLLVRPKVDRRETARPAAVPSPALAADSHGTL
jgi:hypothetical protein